VDRIDRKWTKKHPKKSVKKKTIRIRWGTLHPAVGPDDMVCVTNVRTIGFFAPGKDKVQAAVLSGGWAGGQLYKLKKRTVRGGNRGKGIGIVIWRGNFPWDRDEKFTGKEPEKEV